MRCSKEKNLTNGQWNVFLANDKKGENRTVLMKSDPVPGFNTYQKMKNCKNCNDYTSLF
jgi:hypothetical protein